MKECLAPDIIAHLVEQVGQAAEAARHHGIHRRMHLFSRAHCTPANKLCGYWFVNDLQIFCHFTTQNSETALKTNDGKKTILNLFSPFVRTVSPQPYFRRSPSEKKILETDSMPGDGGKEEERLEASSSMGHRGKGFTYLELMCCLFAALGTNEKFKAGKPGAVCLQTFNSRRGSTCGSASESLPDSPRSNSAKC